MPPHATSISRPCEYYGRNGMNCGKPSYNGTCKIHRNRTSLKPCILCGRGTASKTGYCTCSYKQVSLAQKMKRHADIAEASRVEMEAYIENLLSWDWQGYLDARAAPA